MTAVRVLFYGGALAFRALFNWIHPAMLVPTLIGLPLFQLIFFVYLGRAGGRDPESFFIVGNAIQACAMASVYGPVMVISNDRTFGTLPFVLATPAQRAPLLFGRGLPFLAGGFLISTLGLLAGGVLFGYRPPASSVPALLLVVAIVVVSCTAFGLFLGTVGLRAREPIFLATLAYPIMLLLCGVNIPIERLPSWVEPLGHALPLTHGIDAARAIGAGRPLGSVSGDIAAELSVGAAYAIATYALFGLLERQTRRRGTSELM